MDGRTKLEIQNLTPHPIVWASVEHHGEDAPDDASNILREALPAARGRVFDDVAPGKAHLVLGVQTGGTTERVESSTFGLLPGGGVSARVTFRDGSFAVACLDAGVYREGAAGERVPLGTYRWEGIAGRSLSKD